MLAVSHRNSLIFSCSQCDQKTAKYSLKDDHWLHCNAFVLSITIHLRFLLLLLPPPLFSIICSACWMFDWSKYFNSFRHKFFSFLYLLFFLSRINFSSFSLSLSRSLVCAANIQNVLLPSAFIPMLLFGCYW